jgi:hypothetical protein
VGEIQFLTIKDSSDRISAREMKGKLKLNIKVRLTVKRFTDLKKDRVVVGLNRQ